MELLEDCPPDCAAVAPARRLGSIATQGVSQKVPPSVPWSANRATVETLPDNIAVYNVAESRINALMGAVVRPVGVATLHPLARLDTSSGPAE